MRCVVRYVIVLAALVITAPSALAMYMSAKLSNGTVVSIRITEPSAQAWFREGNYAKMSRLLAGRLPGVDLTQAAWISVTDKVGVAASGREIFLKGNGLDLVDARTIPSFDRDLASAIVRWTEPSPSHGGAEIYIKPNSDGVAVYSSEVRTVDDGVTYFSPKIGSRESAFDWDSVSGKKVLLHGGAPMPDSWNFSLVNTDAPYIRLNRFSPLHTQPETFELGSPAMMSMESTVVGDSLPRYHAASLSMLELTMMSLYYRDHRKWRGLRSGVDLLMKTEPRPKKIIYNPSDLAKYLESDDTSDLFWVGHNAWGKLRYPGFGIPLGIEQLNSIKHDTPVDRSLTFTTCCQGTPVTESQQVEQEETGYSGPTMSDIAIKNGWGTCVVACGGRISGADAYRALEILQRGGVSAREAYPHLGMAENRD